MCGTGGSPVVFVRRANEVPILCAENLNEMFARFNNYLGSSLYLSCGSDVIIMVGYLSKILMFMLVY